MTFGALIGRINSGVIQSLSDVTVAAPGVSCSGVFQKPYQTAFGMAESSVPELTVKAEDWPDVARGSICAVGSISYRVVAVEPDGHGLTTLRLELE